MDIKPYAGKEPFLSFCFCPEDEDQAKKLIAQLIERGCRIDFYPATSAKNEQLRRETLGRAAVCVFYFSGNSLRDHFFRREFTGAVFAGKPIAAIMAEQLAFPYGIGLQLEQTQKYNLFAYAEEEFYEQFLRAQRLFSCVGSRQVKTKCFSLTQLRTGRVIPLSEGIIRIGRMQTECDVVIENKYVGRCHAILTVSKTNCMIRDNNSKNKTCVNSAELSPERVYGLNDGDRITFANEVFSFSSKDEQEVFT